ncbi:hypothetical protein BASA81_003994 [Batrachochytrium salamandrivorans]|nr:hypothetical protein BASA81_003994 [Batrachochytrium salamandrivorans]
MSSLDGVDDSVGASLADLRKEPSSPLDWVLVGFDSQDKSHLVLLGSGTGGIEELAGSVPESDIAYGVIRRVFEYDQAVGMGSAKVTKFIRVCWRPDAKISMKRKMKIGVLDGAIKKILGSTHTDLEAETKADLTDAAVLELIERITQKRDNVAAADGKQSSNFLMGGVAHNARTAQGDSSAAKAKQDGYLDASHLTGGAKGAEVAFEDLEAIQQALASVRDDRNPEVNWVLTGYKDKKTIELIGTGAGGVDELLQACRPATVCYGLFRVTEQIDKTTAVKFCFLTWQPEDVPVMARAAISTHKGAVQPVFRPYHVDFQVADASELDHERVMDHIMSLSGTKSKVTDKQAEHKVDVYERKNLGGLTVDSEVKVQFVDRDALVEAVKRVRDDRDLEVDWIVANYDIDGKELKLALRETGAGGLDEFKLALGRDTANMSYGLLRQTQVVELAEQVKFIFVVYQGEQIATQVKAKVGTFKGGVWPIFQPFHGDAFVDQVDELTPELVQQKLWKF